MSANKENNNLLGVIGLIQVIILVWWTLVTPWPRHIVLVVWYIVFEGMNWYVVWRNEK